MSLPVVNGPPLLKSSFALPQGRFAEQLLCPQLPAVADELTCTLFVGPPTIAMVPVPCMLNAACGGVELGLCGSRTKIGIGEDASITPQTAEPRTGVLRVPLSSPAKYVGTWSVTFT